MEESASARVTHRWWILASFAVLAFYLWTAPRSWQCEGVDEIEYLGLAHSIERGEGYTLYGQPYVYYPPLYPWLVSLVMRHDVTAWRLMYAINALLGFAGLWYLANELRRRGGAAGRWASWLALLSYYPWSFSTRYLMAEPLFVLLGSVALVHASRWLERGRGFSTAPAMALLAAMTKASAIAVTAGLCAASAAHALAKRSWKSFVFCVAVAVLGFGFQVGWEVRAQRVDPNASESYARWAMKYLGLSKETEGMVAKNLGEGLEKPEPLPVRAVLLMVKTGQYLLSAPRIPPNFGPLGILLFVVLLLGLVRAFREDPSSPFAWYTAVSLAMITMTSWVSSYHRYLVPLTPLLFYFLVEGLGHLNRLLDSPRRNVVLVCAIVAGLVSFGWTLRGDGTEGLAGFERRYVKTMWMACANIYLFMTVIAFGELVRGRRAGWSIPGWLPRALVVALALQAFGLAGARFKRTLENAMPEARNLSGAIACGAWIKDQTPPGAIVQASFPRMVSFLCDRRVVSGVAEFARIDYVMLTGELRDVPAFRADEELRLRESVMVSGQSPAFSSGDAAVYKVGPGE